MTVLIGVEALWRTKCPLIHLLCSADVSNCWRCVRQETPQMLSNGTFAGKQSTLNGTYRGCDSRYLGSCPTNRMCAEHVFVLNLMGISNV